MSDDEDVQDPTNYQKLTRLAQKAELEAVVNIKDVVGRLVDVHMTVELLLTYKTEEEFKKDLMMTGPGAPGLTLGVVKALWEALG